MAEKIRGFSRAPSAREVGGRTEVEDVDGTVAELRRRGVTIVTEPFELPVIQRRLAFFADPFGNLFELAAVVG